MHMLTFPLAAAALFGKQLHLLSVFFMFWVSSSNHCLASLDLRAGVEQPFDCLIVQNSQGPVAYQLNSAPPKCFQGSP